MVIYVFSDENCLPKYVGKAKDLSKRIKEHYKDRIKYNTWFYRWLNKQIKEEKEVFVDILEEVFDDNWQEREKYWIKHIKELNYELTNMTDGGDGNNNQIFSKETINKRNESRKWYKPSEETKKKISEGHMGKFVSEITRGKLRQANLGKKYTEEQKLICAKAVDKFDLEGNFIEDFPSLTHAANSIKTRKGTLANVIGRKKSQEFLGFIWKYKINKI